MENIETVQIYDPHVPRGNETKPTSVRMTADTKADYDLIQKHHRVKLAGAVAIAGAELARRIRAEQPAPKRKR